MPRRLADHSQHIGLALAHVRVCCAASEVYNQMKRLELKLNLGQAMVYRTFVALQHSK